MTTSACRVLTLAIVAVITVALGVAPKTARAEQREPPAFVWGAAAQLRVVRWSTGDTRDVLASAPVMLANDELLLVPVRAGARLRIGGDVSDVGLAFGAPGSLDAVTWSTAELVTGTSSGTREVYVPAWTTGRFVVVRGAASGAPTAVRVEIAAGLRDPFAWYRFDGELAAWLESRAIAPAPAPPAPQAARVVRWLEAARHVLRSAGVDHDLAAAWLMARWLDLSMRLRPVSWPYFLHGTTAFSGGRDADAGARLDEATDWRLASAGERIVIAADADLVRVALKARRGSFAHVVLREGDAAARVLRWSRGRATEATAWSDPEWVRLVVPARGREVSVEVVAGEVAVAAVAYVQSTDLLDAFAKRRARRTWVDRTSSRRLSAAVDVAFQRAVAADADPRPGLVSAIDAIDMPRASPEVLALLAGERSRRAPSPRAAHAAGAEAVAALADANPAIAGPIARGVLDHLREVLDESAPRVALRSIEAANEDDAHAIAVARAVLGESSGASAAAEELYARAHGELPDAAARAHQAWLREMPWHVLTGDAPYRWAVRPAEDEPGDPMCRARSDHGLRWTLLEEARTVVPVAARAGMHARVILRGGFEGVPRDGAVLVDDNTVNVHAAAGLPSFVAVAEGPRVFALPEGAPPVLARIPRDDRVPCRSLRELERWTIVEQGGAFSLPAASTGTVGQVVIANTSPGASPTRVNVRAGSASYETWIRPQRVARIEIAIPPGVRLVHVEAAAPVEVRALARMRGAAPPPATVAPEPAPSGDTEEWLAGVRRETRIVRAGTPGEQRAARARRAALLDALGYHRLALLDAPPPAERAESEDVATAPDEIALPNAAPAVDPIGVLPRVPPLPVTGDEARLAAARALHERGDAAAVVASLVDALDGDAATLLLAVDAERIGMSQLASTSFERIAQSRAIAAPLAHAAELAADAALVSSDRVATLRAFVLAQVAKDRGDETDIAFARLLPAITWMAPARADAAAGFASVASRAVERPPLAERVRRAWIDAADETTLVAEGQHVEARFRQATPTQVTVRSRCEMLDSAGETCALAASVDGAAMPCARRDDGALECAARVTGGEHRIEVRGAPDREVVGWAFIALDDGRGRTRPLEARRVSSWFEVDAARGFELAFAAPTVLRIEARGDPAEPREIAIAVEGSRHEDRSIARWSLPSEADPRAARVVAGQARERTLATDVERRIAILAPGPKRVRIDSPQGRVLVRVSVAWAAALPRPRLARASPPAGAGDEPARDAPAAPPKPAVLDDVPYGPSLTVGASTTYVARPVDIVADDERASSRGPTTFGAYVEGRAWARREIADHRAWLSAFALVRGRDGPASGGAGATFDATSRGYVPGGHASVLGVTQPAIDGGTATGVRGVAQAYASVPLTTATFFVPWVSVTAQRTDAAVRGSGGADPDVYTPYASTHPVFATAAVRLAARPFLDTILRAQTSARSTSSFDGAERADARLEVDTLPGAGLWPWLGLAWTVSYRPAVDGRPRAFVRDVFSARAIVWKWIAYGHRVSVDVALHAIVDLPGPTGAASPFAGSIGLSYDWTGMRGVRDFPPRDAPFRDRLEEGSGRVHRVEPPIERGWIAP